MKDIHKYSEQVREMIRDSKIENRFVILDCVFPVIALNAIIDINNF